MKHWTIAKRLTAAFSVVLFLTLGLAGFGLWKFSAVREFTAIVRDDAFPGMTMIESIQAQSYLNYAYTLKHLGEREPSAKKQLEERIATATAHINKVLEEYGKSVSEGKNRQLFEALTEGRKGWVATRVAILRLSSEAKVDDAWKLVHTDLEAEFKLFNGRLDDLLNFELETGDAAAKGATQAANTAKVGLEIVTVLTLLVATLLAWTMVKQINRSLIHISDGLNDNVCQCADASAQVASASAALAEGASEQAASLEETSASVEEIASMSRRNVETAHHARELAEAARRAAQQGGVSTQNLVGAVDGIRATCDEMGKTVGEIKSASDSVSRIIKTIDEIAFQTNILALNAAVEAARAGEAGAGFAVVADEVRNLAQRSATAAKETAALIEASSNQAQRGVEVNTRVLESLKAVSESADEVAKVLGDISTGVQQVEERVGEIAAASKEQASGVSQISVAITQIDKVTQANAASAEETASASAELQAQNNTQRETIADLLSMVTGVRSSQQPLASPDSRSAAASTVVTTPASTEPHREIKPTAAPAAKAP